MTLPVPRRFNLLKDFVRHCIVDSFRQHYCASVSTKVYETEKKYTSILRVLSVDVSRQIAATCENDKALLGAFLPLYEPIRRIVKNLHSFHESNLQEPMRQHIAGQRQGYFWSIFDEQLTTLARLYASYYVTYDEVQKKLATSVKRMRPSRQPWIQSSSLCRTTIRSLN